jgi:hypothetical protein
MRTTLFAISAVATLAASTVSGQGTEIISINDGSIIVCRSLSAAQTMYVLVVNDQVQNVGGCWAVDAPMEVIVLQDGPRFSNISYRTRITEEDVAEREAAGRTEAAAHLRQMLEENPWSPWYRSPAWAFTAWLQPSE